MATNDSQKRLNQTLALRTNNLGLYRAQTSLNSEALYSNTGRYCDPLIRDKIHDISVGNHRHRVAREDPLGQILTFMFGLKAFSKAPRFYDSDDEEAQEIMEQTRQIFEMLKLEVPMSIGIGEMAAHGWVLLYWWVEMDMMTGMPKRAAPMARIIVSLKGVPLTRY
jgi:hypothetical protein